MSAATRRATAIRRGPEAYAAYLAATRAKKRKQRAARYAAGLTSEGKPLKRPDIAAARRAVHDPDDTGCRYYIIEQSGLPYVRRAAYEYGLECCRRGFVPPGTMAPFQREFEDGWAEGAKVAGIPLFDAARSCPT